MFAFVGRAQSARRISESALFAEAAGATDESSTTDSDPEDGIDDDIPLGLMNDVSPKKKMVLVMDKKKAPMIMVLMLMTLLMEHRKRKKLMMDHAKKQN